jgi:hypothetical protein
MPELLLWIGRLAGALGVLLSAAAVLARFSGAYTLGSFQVTTLLQGGTAAMVLACLGYIASMSEGRSASR